MYEYFASASQGHKIVPEIIQPEDIKKLYEKKTHKKLDFCKYIATESL